MKTFNSIASDIFNIPVHGVHDALTSKDIPDWDSMNYLLLIGELEKQFNVSFDMQDILDANTLGDIRKVLVAKGVNV